MTFPRSLIIGASGFLGNTIWRTLPAHLRVGTFCSHPVEGLRHLDIADTDKVRHVVTSASPDVVFLPADIPNVEYCETHHNHCWRVNVEGTTNVVRMARETGAKLVFFSSDYIFDGKSGPYVETDVPAPVNFYGLTKLVAEQFIQGALTNYLIVRLTVLYGWEFHGKNFVARLIERLGKGEQIKVPVDQVGSPTFVDNLVDAVLELVERDCQGIYHVVGPELMDRYSFSCIAADVFNLDTDLLIPVTTPELRQIARRPLAAGMRIDKVTREIQTQLVGPREGLCRMMRGGNPFLSDGQMGRSDHESKC